MYDTFLVYRDPGSWSIPEFPRNKCASATPAQIMDAHRTALTTSSPVNCLVRPHPLFTSRIQYSFLVHVLIIQSKTSSCSSNEETASSTGEIACGISSLFFLCSPYPLCDDLPEACTRVVQCNSKWYSEQARRVACYPICHAGGHRECPTRRKAQTSVSLHIGICWEETSSKPSDAADHGSKSDMPTSCVESVCAVRQCNGTAEANDPWRDGEELSFDRTIPKPSDDGRREESKRALWDNVGNLE